MFSRPLAPLTVAALLASCAGPRESLAPPELLVEVLPRLADVSLDGAPVGKGTRAVPAPAPGSHRLLVAAEGYEPAERPLPPGPLAGARVAVALRPA
ncbi:MAG TPA: PEGA domain-containing protein, partial [Anaeromyxobacteraceae bacterium]|nr:PEGA domain-containing protein [Anaeromyxobacteraceae bacterium]